MFPTAIPLRATATLLAVCALLGGAPVAAAQEDASAWASVSGESRVLMPPPDLGGPVASAAMSCSAQVWTMSIDFGTAPPPASGRAMVAVPRGSFASTVSVTGHVASIVLPREALEPMMAGTRLTVTLPGAAELRFPLTGSRRAITAAAALCSPRDVVMADGVTLSPFSSYLDLARQLRREDIEDFTLSTTAQPRMRIAMSELEGGRRILFVELCGSSWYYGSTGCSLTGFSPIAGKAEDKPSGWRIAFEAEGVFIRIDQASRHDGWPDLATIPLHEGSEETRWSWNGERYLPADASVAGPQPQKNGG